MAIDNLDYFYHQDNKNLLLKVTDATNATQGFNDDSDGTDDTTDDYSYDANGNMTKDENKNITSIRYNHLNLPVRIDFVNNRKIEYLYNAIGQKLQKKVFYNEPTVSTDYVDGFQYTNGILKFFPHAEGYANAVFSEDKYKFYYVFSYLDHLGNIRLNYGEDPSDGVLKIMEENHYYPFGLKHSNYNTGAKGFVKELEMYRLTPVDVVNVPYKYKYNGKEWQDELGLNMYDYGARNYDPAIGRWMNMDPLAETSRRWTPYNYCYNNPMYFVDPDGMQANLPDDNDDIITKVSNTRGDKHYKQRDVNMTMTLTVVNGVGADLSKTMFNKSSGTIALSALSGNAQSDNRAVDISTSDNLNVSVSYKVVESLADVGKDDHVMVIADNIPKTKDSKVDPVGLAESGGRVSAVEKGTIVNKTFNETATHEIGHLLGLDHRNGGLMNPSLSGSMATSQRERGEIINGGEGQISPTTGNGTYKQSSGNSHYNTSIKSQVNNFTSKNNIDW